MNFNFTGTAGLDSSVDLTADSMPIEFVNLFITDEIIDNLVAETNRFASQFLQATSLKRKARASNWSATNPAEMKQFIGCLLLTGIDKKPHIEDYWSSDPLLQMPVFGNTMPRDRFALLLKFLHFSDNEACPEGDRLHKLRSICDNIILRFQAVYHLYENVSIDESMVLWRGRLIFRQYIPGKRHKYGVKLYLLCQPNGYVWNFMVYCGKMDSSGGLGHAESVVMKLMHSIHDKGHVLFTDNFYTSVPLAKKLLKRKTHLCGTLRRNRKYLPQSVVSKPLKKGEVVSRRNGDIVVTKWKDKRYVLMLSTMHHGKVVDGTKHNRRGELVKKPDCVFDYNEHMGGVDRLDQLISYYSPLRKTLKWYKKVVLQVFDFAVTNAFLIYKEVGGTRRNIWFRKQVIRSLISSDDRPGPAQGSVPQVFHHHRASDLSRLAGQHYMGVLRPTSSKAAPTTKCVVCRNRGVRKETRYICRTCPSRPALCVVPCFEDFHSCIDFS